MYDERDSAYNIDSIYKYGAMPFELQANGVMLPLPVMNQLASSIQQEIYSVYQEYFPESPNFEDFQAYMAGVTEEDWRVPRARIIEKALGRPVVTGFEDVNILPHQEFKMTSEGPVISNQLLTRIQYAKMAEAQKILQSEDLTVGKAMELLERSVYPAMAKLLTQQVEQGRSVVQSISDIYAGFRESIFSYKLWSDRYVQNFVVHGINNAIAQLTASRRASRLIDYAKEPLLSDIDLETTQGDVQTSLPLRIDKEGRLVVSGYYSASGSGYGEIDTGLNYSVRKWMPIWSGERRGGKVLRLTMEELKKVQLIIHNPNLRDLYRQTNPGLAGLATHLEVLYDRLESRPEPYAPPFVPKTSEEAREYLQKYRPGLTETGIQRTLRKNKWDIFTQPTSVDQAKGLLEDEYPGMSNWWYRKELKRRGWNSIESIQSQVNMTNIPAKTPGTPLDPITGEAIFSEELGARDAREMTSEQRWSAQRKWGFTNIDLSQLYGFKETRLGSTEQRIGLFLPDATEIGSINVQNVKSFSGEGIYIGRKSHGFQGSPLGNQYTVSQHGREGAIEKYREWLPEAYEKDPAVRREIDNIVQRVERGENVDLLCWCHPQGCHGDVVKEFARNIVMYNKLGREGAFDPFPDAHIPDREIGLSGEQMHEQMAAFVANLYSRLPGRESIPTGVDATNPEEITSKEPGIHRPVFYYDEIFGPLHGEAETGFKVEFQDISYSAREGIYITKKTERDVLAAGSKAEYTLDPSKLTISELEKIIVSRLPAHVRKVYEGLDPVSRKELWNPIEVRLHPGFRLYPSEYTQEEALALMQQPGQIPDLLIDHEENITQIQILKILKRAIYDPYQEAMASSMGGLGTIKDWQARLVDKFARQSYFPLIQWGQRVVNKARTAIGLPEIAFYLSGKDEASLRRGEWTHDYTTVYKPHKIEIEAPEPPMPPPEGTLSAEEYTALTGKTPKIIKPVRRVKRPPEPEAPPDDTITRYQYIGTTGKKPPGEIPLDMLEDEEYYAAQKERKAHDDIIKWSEDKKQAQAKAWEEIAKKYLEEQEVAKKSDGIKLAVVGSRSITDRQLIYNKLDEFSKQNKIIAVVSGGAKGVDSIAEEWAREHNIPVEIYKPDWGNIKRPGAVVRQGKYGPYDAAAGMERNQLIIDAADYVIAFWDEKSTGTKSSIDLAKRAGKPYEIVTPGTAEFSIPKIEDAEDITEALAERADAIAEGTPDMTPEEIAERRERRERRRALAARARMEKDFPEYGKMLEHFDVHALPPSHQKFQQIAQTLSASDQRRFKHAAYLLYTQGDVLREWMEEVREDVDELPPARSAQGQQATARQLSFNLDNPPDVVSTNATPDVVPTGGDPIAPRGFLSKFVSRIRNIFSGQADIYSRQLNVPQGYGVAAYGRQQFGIVPTTSDKPIALYKDEYDARYAARALNEYEEEVRSTGQRDISPQGYLRKQNLGTIGRNYIDPETGRETSSAIVLGKDAEPKPRSRITVTPKQKYVPPPDPGYDDIPESTATVSGAPPEPTEFAGKGETMTRATFEEYRQKKFAVTPARQRTRAMLGALTSIQDPVGWISANAKIGTYQMEMSDIDPSGRMQYTLSSAGGIPLLNEIQFSEAGNIASQALAAAVGDMPQGQSDPKAVLATLTRKYSEAVNKIFDEGIRSATGPLSADQVAASRKLVKKLGDSVIGKVASDMGLATDEDLSYKGDAWPANELRLGKDVDAIRELAARDPVFAKTVSEAGGAEAMAAGPGRIDYTEGGAPVSTGRGGGMGGAGGGTPASRSRSIWGSPMGQALYSVYLAKRFWGMTMGPELQAAQQYQGRLAAFGAMAGEGDWGSVARQAARASLLRETMAEGSWQQYGGFADIGYNIMQRYPSLPRVISGLKMGGAGVAAGILSMGAAGLSFLSGTTAGAGIFTGGAAIAAIGGAAILGTIGMEAYNAIAQPEEPVTWSSIATNAYRSNIIARGASRAYEAGDFDLIKTDEIPVGVLPEYYIGDLVNPKEAKWRDYLTEAESDFIRYEQTRSQQLDEIKSITEGYHARTGEEPSASDPVIMALGRMIPGGVEGNKDLIYKFGEAVGKSGMSSAQALSQVSSIAEQMGIAPGTASYSSLIREWAQAPNEYGRYQLGIKAQQIARYTGSISGYFQDTQQASALIRKYGITTQGQAQGLQSLLSVADMFGYSADTSLFNVEPSAPGTSFTTIGQRMAEMRERIGSYRATLGGQLAQTLASAGVPILDALGAVETMGIYTPTQLQTAQAYVSSAQQYGFGYGAQARELAAAGANVTPFRASMLTSMAGQMMATGRYGGDALIQLTTQTQGMSNQDMMLLSRMLGGDISAWSYRSYQTGDMYGRMLDMTGKPVYTTDFPGFMGMLEAQAPTNPYAAKALQNVPWQQAATPGQIAMAADAGVFMGRGMVPSGASLLEKTMAFFGTSDTEAAQAWIEGGAQGRNILHMQRMAGLQGASAALAIQGINMRREFLWGGGTPTAPGAGSMWALEDQMRQLQRESQLASFAYTQQRMETGQQFAIRQEAINLQRMGVQNQWQRYALEFNQQGALLQRGWTREDWQFQDTTRGLNRAWAMEDINEAIRFSSGRERRQLVRQRDRMVVSQNLEDQQIDKTRSRQEELWARQDEYYVKQKQYIEDNIALNENAFNLSKEQRETFYEMDRENLARQMEEYEAQYELQSEIIEKQRAFEVEQLNLQEQQAKIQAAAAAETAEYAKQMQIVQDSYENTAGFWETMMKNDPTEPIKALSEFSIAISEIRDGQIDGLKEMMNGVGGINPVLVDNLNTLFWQIDHISPAVIKELRALITDLYDQ